MDPINLIVQALLAGAAAGTKDTCKKVVKDSYGRLIRLIKKQFDKKRRHEQGKLLLENFQRNPKACRGVMIEALRDIDISEEIITQTKRLVKLLEIKEGLSIEITGDSSRSVTAGVLIGDVTVGQGFEQGGEGHYKEGSGNGGKSNEGDSNGFHLPKGLILSEAETDCMLRIAIKPELKYPICKHPAVTHASGAAVASLVTQALAREIRTLRNRFVNCARSIIREAEPSVERVDEYTFELARLKHDLERIAGRDYSTEGSKRGSLVNEAFARIELGNKILCAEVVDILVAAGERISKIELLKGDIPAKATGNWKNKVTKKFVLNGIEIEKLGDRLGKVSDDMLSLMDKVKTDWNKDHNVIWDAKCEPTPEQQRECKCDN